MGLLGVEAQILVLKQKEATKGLDSKEKAELAKLEAQEKEITKSLNPSAQKGAGDTGLEVEKSKKQPEAERPQADIPRSSVDELAEALKEAKDHGDGANPIEKYEI